MRIESPQPQRAAQGDPKDHMTLANWARLMSFATITALIYTHMQMQIVELAYRGKDKEKHVTELMDNNGALTHQVLALKSASYLGQELLQKDDGLEFMGRDNIMRLPGPAAMARAPERPGIKAENPLWNWLSFLSPPDAKAWDR